MKKIFILLCVILIVISIGIFYLNNKQKEINAKAQLPIFMEENIDLSSLKSGDIVSVFIDSKENIANRIMICDNIESCQMPNRPNNQEGKSLNQDNNKKGEFAGIIGTINNIQEDNISVELETGEIKTITLSEQTQIFKK
jgi:hypothetical protein